MNKLICIYILLIAIYSCDTNSGNTINVAGIKTTYILRSGSEIKHKEEHFDSLGNCIKEIYFGSRPGDTVSIVENTYAVALLLQSIEKNRLGEIQQTTINHYDNTYLKEKIIIRKDDTMLIQNFIYHANGNLKREITQFPQGKTTPVISIRNYDLKGNPETTYDQIYEDSSMIVLGRYEMTSFNNTYDTSSNRLLKVVATKLLGYYEMADTLYITSFNHDSLGRLIKQNNLLKPSNEVPDSIQFEYTDNGLILYKISYYSSGDITGHNNIDSTFYLYNKKDQLIGEQDTNGLNYRYEYK